MKNKIIMVKKLGVLIKNRPVYDTIIVNFQLSIVNSAKPFKQQFVMLGYSIYAPFMGLTACWE